MRQRWQAPRWIVVLAAASAVAAVLVAENASGPRTEERGELLVRVGDPPLAVTVEDAGGDPGRTPVPLRLTSYEPDRVVDSLSGALDKEPALARLEKLAEPMRTVSVSVERACPPPALLACRPGLRVAARLGRVSPRSISRWVGEIARDGLRHAAFRDLRVRSSADGSGIVRSGNESVAVAEWKMDGTTLQLVVGGLEIDATTLAPPPPHGCRAGGVPARTRVRIDTPSLAALLSYDIAGLRHLSPSRASRRPGRS